MEDFKQGDIVKIKTGSNSSPVMVIEQLKATPRGDVLCCYWSHPKSEFVKITMNPAALIKSEPIS